MAQKSAAHGNVELIGIINKNNKMWHSSVGESDPLLAVFARDAGILPKIQHSWRIDFWNPAQYPG